MFSRKQLVGNRKSHGKQSAKQRDIRTISYIPKVIKDAFAIFYSIWAAGLLGLPIFVAKQYTLLSVLVYSFVAFIIIAYLILTENYITAGNRTGSWGQYSITLFLCLLFNALLAFFFVFIQGGIVEGRLAADFFENRNILHQFMLIWLGWLIVFSRIVITELFYWWRRALSPVSVE